MNDPFPRQPNLTQHTETKNTIMKNTLLALLGFILFSTPLAATAQAVDGFTYSSDGSAITITRYYGPGGAVNIPSAINGVPVTTIGPNAFYNQIGLTSVTLPGTVTSIEDSAFGGCSNLTSVNIPGSVTNIGNAAFWACTSLTTVTIPAAVSRIGGGAFQSSGLTSITIPGTVRTIEDYAFSFCSNLMAIIVNAMNPSYSSLDGVLFN